MAKKKKNTILLPEELSDEAQVFIKTVINDLKAKDRLETVDTAALYILAQSAHIYIEANKHIKEEGLTFTSDRGNISISPYVTIARDATKTILSIISEFGGTLRSRQKLKELDGQVEDSPLATFIKQACDED